MVWVPRRLVITAGWSRERGSACACPGSRRACPDSPRAIDTARATSCVATCCDGAHPTAPSSTAQR
eukprot:3381596-Prymnesium_polylepis.5